METTDNLSKQGGNNSNYNGIHSTTGGNNSNYDENLKYFQQYSLDSMYTNGLNSTLWWPMFNVNLGKYSGECANYSSTCSSSNCLLKCNAH